MAGSWARVSVSVKGMEEVKVLLDRVKKVANPRLIQEYATLPAAMIIRDNAKRRVRRGAGRDTMGNPRRHLEELIFAARGHGRDGSSIAGVDYHKAPHAHLLELGTKPHLIRPKKRGGWLWIKKLGLRLRFVRHPGVNKSKTAFLRPAARTARAAVRKRLEHGLKRLLYDVLHRREVSF